MENVDYTKYEINPNDYERMMMIGSGDVYNVYAYTNKITGVNYVGEILHDSFLNANEKKRFYDEIKVNALIGNHPCVNKFIGFFFQKKDLPVMIADFCSNGSLEEMLKNERDSLKVSHLNSTRKLITIYGIASGMSHIHSLNIVHRDLKTGNILFDNFLHPKIRGFWDSKIIDESKASRLHQQTTIKTVAPECFNEYNKFCCTKPIDVYSFAIILYEIVTNEEPYKGETELNIINNVKIGKRSEFKKQIPKCYQNLIERCWSQEPSKRPTFDEIVRELETNPEFITSNVNEAEYIKYIKYVKDPESVSYESEQLIEQEKVQKKLNVDLEPINLSQFEKQNKIGFGSFGKIYKVLNKKTKEINACKISIKPIDICTDDEIQNLEREIRIISKLNFPSILKMIGSNPKNFKDESRPVFITELASNGSLDVLLDIERKGLSDDKWNDTKKLIIIYEIAAGMSYMHKNNILHRDLKPGNIFVDEYLFPKIGDFGLSKEISLENEKQQIKSGNKGTYPFMSPEIINQNEYTKAGDVYAFAIIVYQIITNEEIFNGWQPFQIILNVYNGYRPNIPPEVTQCYRKLIEQCWNHDPKKRPSFDEIVETLKTNPDFIIDTVDADEFYNYVDYIEQMTPEKLETKDELQKSLIQTFEKVNIDLKLAEKTIDEDDKISKENFLDLTNYHEIKLCNKGETWKLIEIQNNKTGAIYTAKIITIKLTKMNKNDIIHLSHEINRIAKIEHPSILKFIGYSPTEFWNKKCSVIITEHATNGTLAELISKVNKNQENSKWNATLKLINIYGIAEGMKYLHFNNIIHRNLTPENIFLDEELHPKIGNFGLSTHFHTLESMTYQTTSGVKGNPFFSAPEVLQMNKYSKSSDVYSFGMIVYEIMTNEIPFENMNGLNQLYNKVALKSSRPEINEKVPESYRKLIELCWSQNAKDRPTFNDITKNLKVDRGFITDSVDEAKYFEYIKYITFSDAKFYKAKKIFNQDDLILSKNKIKETNSESTDSDE